VLKIALRLVPLYTHSRRFRLDDVLPLGLLAAEEAAWSVGAGVRLVSPGLPFDSGLLNCSVMPFLAPGAAFAPLPEDPGTLSVVIATDGEA
jgi:hypothetical protein